MPARFEHNSDLFDFSIIGSGGAGMCLLWALIKTKYIEGKKILVIEPEIKDKNDRTWCFWAKESDPIVQDLAHLTRKHWNETTINNDAKNLGPYAYYMLDGASFYGFIDEQIKLHPQITVIRDRVIKVNKLNNDYMNVSTMEKSFATRYVFDSRVERSGSVNVTQHATQIKQSFFGYKLKLEAGSFNPLRFQMMNFDVPQNGMCQFIYVLPYSEKEALIELTRFGEQVLNKEMDEPLLSEWIKQNFGQYSILERESGVIPMDLIYNAKHATYPPNARHIYIGTAAGCVKPTTGYAFHNMYRHSFNLIHALQNKTALPECHHPKRFTFYDALLLNILKTKPYTAKDIFARLFSKVPMPMVLRFLDEQSTLKQDISVLKSLPKVVFIKALYRHLLQN